MHDNYVFCAKKLMESLTNDPHDDSEDDLPKSALDKLHAKKQIIK